MISIQEAVPLATRTTFGIGGAARYFVDVASEEDVREALLWARQRNCAIFLLGGGSNLLVSDRGFDGLVLHLAIAGIAAQDVADGQRIYTAGAGVSWDALVTHTVAENAAGLECLSGIPGSVGAAPVQNIGAYGQDVAESIVRVHAIDTVTLETVEFANADCGFRYRRSRFNANDRGRYVITRVDYALRPDGQARLRYAELQRRLGGTEADIAQARQTVLELRRRKGMVYDEQDVDTHSAGSFFKNPLVSQQEYRHLAADFVGAVPHFDAGDGQVKLAAAWLIEQAGVAKGFALGQAAVSGKHALALTNRGQASAADIVQLKNLVQEKVRQRFGIELQPEPILLGF